MCWGDWKVWSLREKLPVEPWESKKTQLDGKTNPSLFRACSAYMVPYTSNKTHVCTSYRPCAYILHFSEPSLHSLGMETQLVTCADCSQPFPSFSRNFTWFWARNNLLWQSIRDQSIERRKLDTIEAYHTQSYQWLGQCLPVLSSHTDYLGRLLHQSN